MPNFIPFLMYVLITTFTPGPNNIMSMNNGLRFGYRRTLKFLAGIALGFFLVMLLTGFLNVLLVSLLPQIRMWLVILGVAYMFFLAVHILRSGAPEEGQVQKSSFNSFGAGVGLQFLNLKGILYGVTVFSMYVIPFTRKPLEITVFSLVLTAVCFIAITCWALGGDLFSHLLKRYYLLFNLVMSGSLIYIAIISLLEFFGVGK